MQKKTIKEMKSVTDLRLRKPDRGKDTGKRSKGNRSLYYDNQYEQKSAYGNKDANNKQTRKTNFNKWSQDNKERELNSVSTLASQPAAGHSLSFVITIVIMTLG